MTERRRDNKGRVLRQNESQRPDGRYMYRYTDALGVRRSVYSWRLVETDPKKEGRKDSLPLRELEKQIARDIEDGINAEAVKTMTVDELFDKYMELRTDVKGTTLDGYRSRYKCHIRPYLGHYTVLNVNANTIFKWQGERRQANVSPAVISQSTVLLEKMFDILLYDDAIRKNPVTTVRKKAPIVIPQQSSKKPLTILAHKTLLKWLPYANIKTSYKYLVVLLIGSGLRISEALGLFVQDCDFDNEIITVRHNLRYFKGRQEKMHFEIQTPKTAVGTRVVAMNAEVKTVLTYAIAMRPTPQTQYKDFVFLSDKGSPMLSSDVYQAFHQLSEECNRYEQVQAAIEKREPNLLPQFSPHILRHTFCTRLSEIPDIPIKTIQETMGHADVNTTMRYYAHASVEKKKEAMQLLNEHYPQFNNKDNK